MKEKNIISLSGFGWKADISPIYGMNTIRLSHKGQAILRSPETLDALCTSTTAAYGNPLLIPPNRTEHARFSFDGQCYCLPTNEPRWQNNIHGILHRTTFRVEEKSTHSVTASYRNIGEIFPFPFLVTTHYYLDESGYHQVITFENIGKEDMPLTFGMHTNFIAVEMFKVPIGRKWLKNDCHIPTGTLLELTEEEQKYCVAGTPLGKPITGFFTSVGTTAQIDNVLFTVSENFDQWQVWNSDGAKGFISIEPQCGAVNCLNSGVGLLRLKPGQKEVFTTWFHME